MARTKRCPVCQGPIVGEWGAAPAANRRYCSAACRQAAYRQRAVSPAQRRRASDARRTTLEAAAVEVEAILADISETVGYLGDAAARRTMYYRLSPNVSVLAEAVERLTTATLAYDRAAGATWAELADDTGVDESTLRRRAARQAGGTEPPA